MLTLHCILVDYEQKSTYAPFLLMRFKPRSLRFYEYFVGGFLAEGRGRFTL